jgi:hypothetical protein
MTPFSSPGPHLSWKKKKHFQTGSDTACIRQSSNPFLIVVATNRDRNFQNSETCTLNSFIEAQLAYNKLNIKREEDFVLSANWQTQALAHLCKCSTTELHPGLSLVIFDVDVNLWNRHHNQDSEHFHHLPKLPHTWSKSFSLLSPGNHQSLSVTADSLYFIECGSESMHFFCLESFIQENYCESHITRSFIFNTE